MDAMQRPPTGKTRRPHGIERSSSACGPPLTMATRVGSPRISGSAAAPLIATKLRERVGRQETDGWC